MKKAISILLSLAIIFTSFFGFGVSVNAETFEEDNFEYSIDSNGDATIEGYTGQGKDLVIPSTLGGHTVKYIGTYALYNKNFTSIILPDSLEEIYDRGISLNDMTTLHIPKNLKKIDPTALMDNYYLKSYSVDSENKYFSCVDGVLFNYDKTMLLSYPSGDKSRTTYVIPNTVKTIGYSGMYYCNLKSITIPDSVTEIDEQAFYGGYSFEEIYIPSSVKVIKDTAFMATGSLKRIQVDENNPYYCSEDGVLFNKDKTTLIQMPNASEIESYTIPDGVITIGNEAFWCCSMKK